MSKNTFPIWNFDRLDDINRLLTEYGVSGEDVPSSLIAVVIAYDDLTPLEELLKYGYAFHPRNKSWGWHTGWYNPATEFEVFDPDVDFFS